MPTSRCVWFHQLLHCLATALLRGIHYPLQLSSCSLAWWSTSVQGNWENMLPFDLHMHKFINICIGICQHILYICVSICSHYLHISLTYVFWCYIAWHKWPFTFQSYVITCWHMLKGVMSQMPPAHVPWLLMESSDIGSRRAECRSAVVVFCDVMLLFVVTS